MSEKKTKVVVICPGRGSYNKPELGYLKKYSTFFQKYQSAFDQYLTQYQQPTISELDGAKDFSAALHTPGENASLLIYACGLADFLAIDPDKYEVVCVTGNSLGWYSALGVAQGLTFEGGIKLIHTMGSMMKGGVVGAQVVYPIVDDSWNIDPNKVGVVQALLNEANDDIKVYKSISFGGFVVLGCNEAGLKLIQKKLPRVEDRFPLQLINHAAFHTPLLAETSHKAFQVLGKDLFQKPHYPMIDGRGHIWQPYATDLEELYRYTLGHQVTCSYDFTQAVTVALKEFAPDKLVLLGPGTSTGGAIGQILVKERWLGIKSKQDFQDMQKTEPFLLSMGSPEQLSLVAKY